MNHTDSDMTVHRSCGKCSRAVCVHVIAMGWVTGRTETRHKRTLKSMFVFPTKGDPTRTRCSWQLKLVKSNIFTTKR